MKLLRLSTAATVVLIILTMLSLAGSASAQTTCAAGDTSCAQGWTITPTGITVTLEGCKNDGSPTITFPLPSPLTNAYSDPNMIVCPDSVYTTGNLGKLWSELDLVPFRLTTSSKSGSSTTYNLIIAGEFSASDHSGAARPGWDVIGSNDSIAFLGTDLSSGATFTGPPGPTGGATAGFHRNPNSDSSCRASWDGYFTNGLSVGTSDFSIYRVLKITQNANTTCVWDYFMRLALGSHLYPGSSLHGFTFQSMNFSQGAKDVPLPVPTSLEVQSVSKTMAATQNFTIPWTVTKSATPANLTLPDSCTAPGAPCQALDVTITWTKKPALAIGGVHIETVISATNPASRSISVSVTDVIYGGTDQTNVLDTYTCPPVILAPNAINSPVCTHDYVDISGAWTQYNDIATPTYTDVLTGIPIPLGTPPATASATVQAGSTANTTATIHDVETISDSHNDLTFAVTGTTPAQPYGTFSACTLNSQGTACDWDSPILSGSGSVTFHKNVCGQHATATNGALSDTATLTGSDGYSPPPASATVNVASDALVTLSIAKSATGVTGATTFQFHVAGTGTNLDAHCNPTALFNADGTQTFNACPTVNLIPDTYTVSEDSLTGWVTDSSKTVDLHLPNCSGTATMTNTHQGKIIVNKVTNPASDTTTQFSFNPNYGSSFQLVGGGSNDSGPLSAGTYSVSESPLAGWDLTNSTCDNGTPSAIVVVAGATTTCTFYNSKPDANVTITPLDATNNVGVAHTFTITATAIPNGDSPVVFNSIVPSVSPTPDLQNSNTCSAPNVSGNTATCTLTINSSSPGTFTANVTANVTIGTVALTRATGDGLLGDSPAATKTYVGGKIVVIKHTNPAGSSQSFSFSPSYEAGFGLTDGQNNTSGWLAPGSSYSVSETVPAGWVQTNATCTNGTPGAITVVAGGTTTCDFYNSKPDANVTITPLNATNPVGTAHTFTITATAIPNGATPVVFNSIVPSIAPTPDVTNTNTCATPTIVSNVATCTMTINSSTPTTYTANATANVTIGGLALTRATGDANAGDSPAATKIYVAGYIKVVKHTNPSGSTQSFNFSPSYESGFGLTDGLSNTSGPLAPGSTYSVSETVPAGWDQTNATCSNGTPSAIVVVAGATTTCDFYNSKPDANITITPLNATNPVGTAHTFTITATAIPNGDSPVVFNSIVPGISPTPDVTNTNTCATPTIVSNVATCTMTINSSTPTTYTANATAHVTIGTVALTRATGDANAGDSADAVKVYQAGYIKVVKHTNPAGSTQTFTFSPSYESGFGLMDGQNNTSGPLAPGSTYSVSETVPAGWDQTNATCSNGTPSAIVVVAGATTTCDFYNSKPDGYIAIGPSATNPVGQQHTFTIVVTQVPNGGTAAASANVTYGITPSGYTLVGSTCGASVPFSSNVATCAVTINSSTPTTYTANATATFAIDTVPFNVTTNGVGSNSGPATKIYQAGKITLVKVTVPAGINQVFHLNDSWSSGCDLNAAGTNSCTSGWLAPGSSYSASEVVPSGWDLTNVTCTNGTKDAIVVVAGATTTCTFTNSQRPTIIIKKITDPPNTGSFGFTATGAGYSNFSLVGGGQNSQVVAPGTYTVTEGTQLGWVLTGIGSDPSLTDPLACTVTGPGSPSGEGNLSTQSALITVGYGDTVTCVFENTGSGVTRTQGFWATHSQLAAIAWFGGTKFGHTFPGVGDTSLCGRPIDTINKLMGGFWSGISKDSTGTKRSSLDQGRMQLLNQLLAAELNSSAFGSSPGAGAIAAWKSAYCSNIQSAISTAAGQAGVFNSQGDNSTFTPGTSADSKTGRAIANYQWWDEGYLP